MEGNNMADNNQLMDALIERLKGLQSSALNSYNSSKGKNEFLAYASIIFIMLAVCFIIYIICYHQEIKDSHIIVSIIFVVFTFVIIGYIGIAYTLYKHYLLKQAELEQENEKIIKEREKFLIQSMIDLEYQKQHKNNNDRQEITEEYVILGKPVYKRSKTTTT
ncbi:hypothetical protein [Parabacteroides sp.]